MFDNREGPSFPNNNNNKQDVAIKFGSADPTSSSLKSSQSERSVIIPAGATFSIPLNYTVASQSAVTSVPSRSAAAPSPAADVDTVNVKQEVQETDSAHSNLDAAKAQDQKFCDLGTKKNQIFRPSGG